NRDTKRKTSAKKGTHKLQYEPIVTFNDNIKPNDMISEEPFMVEMVPNVKSDYTFVEENIGLLNSIYTQVFYFIGLMSIYINIYHFDFIRNKIRFKQLETLIICGKYKRHISRTIVIIYQMGRSGMED